VEEALQCPNYQAVAERNQKILASNPVGKKNIISKPSFFQTGQKPTSLKLIY